MKRTVLFVSFFLALMAGNVWAQKTTVVKSPDGAIQFNFKIANGKPSYTVDYMGKPLLKESALDINFNQGGYLQQVALVNATNAGVIHEQYSLVIGKTKHVDDFYTEATLALSETQNHQRKVNLEVRVFNDGLAFRYLFPKQNGDTSLTIYDEKTQFSFVKDPVAVVMPRENYITSHEGLYTTAPLSTITEDTLIEMPALFEVKNEVFVGITEAALLDYAGMYLMKDKNNNLSSKLSPLPHKEGIKVIASLPHQSPWRVLLISRRVGALIESNIITSLNEPCKIKDVSWIKTGLTTFPWWNGTVIPDSIKGGNNFETNKYYIDFCAANNIKYHSIVEYGGHEWYTNDGEGYQPGKHVDVTKPVDGLDMKAICDYAHSKNVGVRVWVHFYALYPQIDSAFAIFEQWGLDGMMVDFMDRDDQEMVNMQTEVLQKAAAYHLHIQFHGAYKNTGLSRTYPNEFTREGTLNYEHDKWDNSVTPDADLNIPFTRMLAGSTDYHLGGFRAAWPKDFEPHDRLPFVMGTRCHMLGMYVVLENPQGMMCDAPSAYIGQSGFELLKYIPTTWDETKVIDAQVGKYISIARRKGNTWYVGTINNCTARTITSNFSFLPKGSFDAEIYQDKIGDSDPNHLEKKNIKLNAQSKLKQSLAIGGGSVIVIQIDK